MKHALGSASAIAPGKSKMYMVNGQPIAVFNVNGSYHAISDRCTHRGGLLHEGELEGTVVTCPLHGAQFDVTNGQNLCPPAPSKVASYKVSIENGALFLEA